MVLTPQYSGYEKRASDMNWKFGTVLQPFNFKCVCHLASTICCCCSVTKSCLTHCDPMDCSTPSFPVLRYFLEFAKTHVHWIDDAIQPCHPLSSPFPPALNLSQLRGLYHLLAYNQVIWAGLSNGGFAPHDHVAESSGSFTGPSRIQADLSHMSGISAEITREANCLSLKTSQQNSLVFFTFRLRSKTSAG